MGDYDVTCLKGWLVLLDNWILNSFVSTVFVRLEHSNWGSRYPILMNELYQGRISVYHLKNCLLKLQSIRIEFSKLSSYDNVCDFEPASSVGKVLRFLLCSFPWLLYHARKIDFKWLLKFENLDVYIYGAFKVTKILRLISIFDDRIQIKLKSIRTPKVKD